MDTDNYDTSGSSPPRPANTATTSSHLTEAPRFRPRACARCSNSKLKCNWVSEPGEGPCERRVGQLEQKLDGIMSLLTASKQVQQPAPSTQTTASTTTSTTTATYVDTPPEAQDSPASASTRGASTAAPSPDSSSHSHASQAHSHLQLPHRHAGSGAATPITTATSSPGSYLPPPPQQQQQQPLPSLVPQPPPPTYPPPENQLPSFDSLLRIHPLAHIEVLPGLKVTFTDADLALNEYRKTYSPHFPFVPLPNDLVAFDFFQTQPFLLKVILQVVLPQSPQMQRDGKRWFREQIALHVVTNEEKSVPLLQAILLYVAWSDLGFYIDPKVTPLLQLATGLVSDLGLHRPIHHEMSLTLNAFIADAATALRGFGYDRPPHTLAGIRAMLGCYYVCALSGSFFRRTPAFPFTAYMEQCCHRLMSANEFESDALAVALARMQRVAARIYAVLPNPEVDAPPASAFAPVYMAMATIRKELDQLVHGSSVEHGGPSNASSGGDSDTSGGLHPSVRANCFLWTHYHAILVRLYEPAIFLRLRTASSSAIDLGDSGLRTEALWNCLQATRDFFDAYTAVPPDILGILPLLGTVHLSFGIVTLTRLLSLDAPEWHIGQARRSFNFVALALRLEQQFQAADELEATTSSSAGASTSSTTTFTSPFPRKRRYAYFDTRTILATHRDKMRWIRIWYTTKMPPDPHQVPPPVQTMAGRASMAPTQMGAPQARPSQQQTQAPHTMPWSAESAVAVASAPVPAAVSQPPYPFPTGTTPAQQPQTPQTTNLMDVDTDNPPTPGDRLIISPGGMNVPLEEFDSTFWKAIFDLDSAWEPMAQ
ncbi:hypothetical protein Sste5344_006458 [Sporothrix stenoceras]